MSQKESKEGRPIIFVSRKLYRTIQAIQSYSREEKHELVRSLLSRFSEEEQERWFRWVRDEVHPEQKWLKVERWMESQFMADKTIKPMKVARMAIHYFRANSNMGPFFVKMAQKVKKRVRMREVREKNMDED